MLAETLRFLKERFREILSVSALHEPEIYIRNWVSVRQTAIDKPFYCRCVLPVFDYVLVL